MTTQMTNLNGELPGHGYSTIPIALDPFSTSLERAYVPAKGTTLRLTDAEVESIIDGIKERSRLWLEEILARQAARNHIITGDLS